MATISENLQTIKNSVSSIKQAISDKGGDVSGDITTWASVISGLNGGGSTDEEITFTGMASYSGSNITLTGLLSSKPELSPIFLILLYLGTSAEASRTLVSDISNTISVTINTAEPLMGNEIPGICLMHVTSGKIFPVTFIRQGNSGGSND